MRRFVLPIVVSFLTVAQAGEWERSFTGAVSTQQGNTNLTSYAIVFTSEYLGDLKLGSLNLKDSEVKLALGHTRGRLNNALYQHDGSASFLVDILAHQTFSPFFLSYWAYDSTTALVKRLQMGVGGKYSVPAGLSISFAYLWEIEEYRKKEAVTQFRLSIRPKYKKKFVNGISINYMIFIQPLIKDFSNFLVDNHFVLSIPTVSEKLKLTMMWRDQFNSQPQEKVEKRDSDFNVGITWLF